jgi:hypothetical protein
LRVKRVKDIAATQTVLVSQGLYTMRVVAKPDVALLRAKAAEFLKAYRDRGAEEIDPSSPERLHRSLSLAAGEEIAGRLGGSGHSKPRADGFSATATRKCGWRNSLAYPSMIGVGWFAIGKVVSLTTIKSSKGFM